MGFHIFPFFKGLVVLKKNSHLLTFFNTTASNQYQAGSSVHTLTKYWYSVLWLLESGGFLESVIFEPHTLILVPAPAESKYMYDVPISSINFVCTSALELRLDRV
jgi:hypothetical protein